jgi:hypothetical protein
MGIKQDTAAIIAAAEAHNSSYAAVLTSNDFKTSAERGVKMATYYLPTVSFFIDGQKMELSGQSNYASLISGTLDKVEGLPGVRGQRVDAISENSAIVWLLLESHGVEISNVYFFRRLEDGTEGFEGGIFDGETWLLKQLAKE